MADQLISDLTAGSAITGADLFEAEQSSTSVKITAAQIAAYVIANPGGTSAQFLRGDGVLGNTLLGPLIVDTDVKVWRGAGNVSGNVAVGPGALASNTTGSQNIGIGSGALNGNLAAYGCVAIGSSALSGANTGAGNLAFGTQALTSNTSGYFNFAAGYSAMTYNTTGIGNVALGYNSLYANIDGSNNVAIGYDAMQDRTTGDNSVALGPYAMQHTKKGTDCFALGYNVFSQAPFASYSVGIGGSACVYANGPYNVGIGNSALGGVYSGTGNVGMGYLAGANLAATGAAISAFADYSATVAGTVKATSTAHGLSGTTTKAITGSVNFNGSKSITVIDANNFYFTATWVSTAGETGWWGIAAEASYNTFIGYNAGAGITTGSNNTIIGGNSANSALSATLTNNIILQTGQGTIRAQFDGTNWTFSGTSLTFATSFKIWRGLFDGSSDVGVGPGTLAATTASNGSVAVGYNAAAATTSGLITAIGASALAGNTTGSGSTALGYAALAGNTTGNFNVAVGYLALYSHKVNSDNVAIGYEADWQSTHGSSNVSVGSLALYSNRTGSSNTAIGISALNNLTTGAANVTVGNYAGSSINGTGKAISAFADYSATVAGTVKATSTAHGLAGTTTKTIAGTTSYNGTYSVTVIDANNFYFTHAWVATETDGWWYVNSEGVGNILVGYYAGYQITTGSYNTILGYMFGGGGITTGSNNTILGSNVSSLSAALTDNIILATGQGTIRAQFDGTDWLLSNGHMKLQVVGKGFFVKEGSNAKMGTGTLVAGTVTISNTSVTASSRIFAFSNTDGGTPGWLRNSARTAGTSFTILSSSATDTSTFTYIIFEPS